jgi:hypothetical protein
VLLFTLSSCSTSSFKVLSKSEFLAEFQVTPDRVILECEDIFDHSDAGNPEGNFGFMVHVLDEEDTVLTLIREPVTTRTECFKKRDYIQRILKNGKKIFIGGHGGINEPRTRGSRSHSSFEKSGTFYDNGRVMQLLVIRNEKDQCFSLDYGMSPPCEIPEFPIKRGER